MHESLTALKAFEAKAKQLDSSLIDGRVAYVQRNLQQIEGRYRSDNYVRRLAGKTTDVERKSRTTAAIQWVGATVFENSAKASEFRAFWQGVFHFIDEGGLILARDFWTLEEETMDLFSRLRKSRLAGDGRSQEVTLAQIKANVDALQKLVSTGFAEDGRAYVAV